MECFGHRVVLSLSQSITELYFKFQKFDENKM
jgi:hypothetical protein